MCPHICIPYTKYMDSVAITIQLPISPSHEVAFPSTPFRFLQREPSKSHSHNEVPPQRTGRRPLLSLLPQDERTWTSNLPPLLRSRRPTARMSWYHAGGSASGKGSSKAAVIITAFTMSHLARPRSDVASSWSDPARLLESCGPTSVTALVRMVSEAGALAPPQLQSQCSPSPVRSTRSRFATRGLHGRFQKGGVPPPVRQATLST